MHPRLQYVSTCTRLCDAIYLSYSYAQQTRRVLSRPGRVCQRNACANAAACSVTVGRPPPPPPPPKSGGSMPFHCRCFLVERRFSGLDEEPPPAFFFCEGWPLAGLDEDTAACEKRLRLRRRGGPDR